MGSNPTGRARKDYYMTKEEKNIIMAMVGSDASWSTTKSMINAMPVTDDIQKTGTWKTVIAFDTLDKAGNIFLLTRAKCSSCNAVVTFVDYNNYCPRCGSNNIFKE